MKFMMETKIQGIVDVHSHILPGVDDGSKNMDMTRQMLQMAWSEGIHTIIATPHHRERYSQASAAKLKETYQAVCIEAEKIDSDFKIYLGSELFRSHSLEEKLASGESLTMAGTNYVLVEFFPSDPYRELYSTLLRIKMAGYKPIVAHAERYQCLVKEPELTEKIVNMGCYIQINASSVTGENGFSVKRYVRKLLKYELVHFLGTDAHDLERRSPMIQESVNYIIKKYGEEYARRISSENALELLNIFNKRKRDGYGNI